MMAYVYTSELVRIPIRAPPGQARWWPPKPVPIRPLRPRQRPTGSCGQNPGLEAGVRSEGIRKPEGRPLLLDLVLGVDDVVVALGLLFGRGLFGRCGRLAAGIRLGASGLLVEGLGDLVRAGLEVLHRPLDRLDVVSLGRRPRSPRRRNGSRPIQSGSGCPGACRRTAPAEPADARSSWTSRRGRRRRPRWGPRPTER